MVKVFIVEWTVCVHYLSVRHGLCTNLCYCCDAEGCFEAKQSEDPLPGPAGYAELQTPPPTAVAAVTQGIIVPKTPKSPFQVLSVTRKSHLQKRMQI